MKFRVERKNWLRGEGAFASKLLREQDGKMCCLGFAALACGYTAEDIKNIGSPGALLDERGVENRFPQGCVEKMEFSGVSGVVWKHLNAKAIADAMRINDRFNVDDAEREQQITETLKEVGLEVEFV